MLAHNAVWVWASLFHRFTDTNRFRSNTENSPQNIRGYTDIFYGALLQILLDRRFSGVSSMQKVGAMSGPVKKWGARLEMYLRSIFYFLLP